jgi:hypothetical protein
MDVVRFAETKGHEYDYEIEGAWRYRDWLIRVLNSDLPFDSFVREQICGDLLQTPRLQAATGENESRLGTIFWNLGESATSPVDLANDEADRIGNQIDVLGRAFLGMTVGCARCHDHKTEPISQRDYYSLFGILASTPLDRVWTNAPQYEAAAKELRRIRVEADQLFEAGSDTPAPELSPGGGRVFADFANGVPDGWQLVGNAEVVTMKDVIRRGVQPGLWSGLLARKLPARIRSPLFTIGSRYIDCIVSGADASIVVSVNNLQVIRDPIYDDLRRRIDRSGEWQVHRIRTSKWIGQPAYLEVFTGRAELLKTTPTERQQFGVRAVVFSDGRQASEPKLASTLPKEIDPRGHELAWAALALERELPLPEYYCGVSEPTLGVDRPLAKRGDAKSPVGIIPRSAVVLAALSTRGEPVSRGSGRREIAEALLSPQNPLTARVFVNRVWHQLFGRGLVVTVDDFGRMGEAPSHSELLDYLAYRFVHVQHGSLKALVREIVLTKAWQRASAPEDADVAWLRAYPMRRQDAEALRDAILVASGGIDRKVGGPSVAVHIGTEIAGGGIRPAEDGALDGMGRRSIYVKTRRNFPDSFLTVFDKPAPSAPFGRRNVSNVPAQALALLNDPFVIEQSRRWSERILADTQGRMERVNKLYRAAFARRANTAELAAADAFIGDSDNPQVWAEFAHALLNLKEFLYVP